MTARVLVVDDIAANIRLLEAKLSAEYFNALTATNGPEAIKLAREQRPDIILLDVMMPGMDGLEVCRRLRADALTRHTPVVMVTALSEVEDRVRGLEAGADDFLAKPINDMALFARIRSLVRLKMVMDEWRLRQSTGERLGLAADSESEDQADAPARVVVIEDTLGTADRVREMLGAEGHEVRAIKPSPSAPAEIAGCEADLVVVSLLLANDAGLKLCAALRSQKATRQTPLLVVVEDGDPERMVKALDLGVNDYILRPIDRNELRARARTQIRRQRFQERLRRDYQQTVAMATTDSLTGVHNRRYACSHLQALVDAAWRDAKPLGLLLVDIDHFKSVNDQHGHAAGDEALRAVANRLTANVRSFDTVARWGGEEFVVIMPEADLAVAQSVAERLRRKVEASPIAVKGGKAELSITISVGVSMLSPQAPSSDDLFRLADAALYGAKHQGRNRVVTDPGLTSALGAIAGAA
jgi:two-component system cell cycle response regulator